MMENYIGKMCPYCKAEIKVGEEIKVCPTCGIPHHVDCWEENHGCTTFGCSEQCGEPPAATPTETCDNCDTTSVDTAEPVPQNEVSNNAAQAACEKCGAPLMAGQLFCGACGQKISAAPTADAANVPENPEQPAVAKKKSKKIWLLILAIVLSVGILGSIGFVASASVQKNKLHNRLMSADWWSYDGDTKLFLDFSEDEIEYSGYFGYYLGTVEIATIDYEVVDGDTIRVYGREIQVELDEDSVVFRPSFVNADSFSLWLD